MPARTRDDGHRFRAYIRLVVFGHTTEAGRAFDLALIWAILASVLLVLVDSVHGIHGAYGPALYLLEWGFTLLFTAEYLLRLYGSARPWRYATSFFGIIDLLAILPTYLSLVLPGAQFLLVIRVLRVLRIFRILKLAHYLSEMAILIEALRQSRRKIQIFLLTVLTLAVVLGSLMYLVEGESRGFTSIPKSIYWTIVTITTVGYGDIRPETTLGQMIAVVVMLLGYAIIAVPTGIVTVELSRVTRERTRPRYCRRCKAIGHEPDASYCRLCGSSLDPEVDLVG